MPEKNVTLHSKPNRLGGFSFRTRNQVKSKRIVASAVTAIIELLEHRVMLSGTTLVDDINKVSLPSNPQSFVVAGSEMFFTADDGTNGQQLWKSDGTSNGTVMVQNPIPGTTSEPFAALGNQVFLMPSSGQGLYISDGTAAGTKMLSSVQPYLSSWTVYNNRLYFEGFDSTHGVEPWTSDGTAAGTYLLSDIASGYSSSSLPQDFVGLNGEVYFAASTPAYGNELWKTDGTAAGTTMVANVTTGVGFSNPTALATMNGKLYFIATNAASNNNLCVSDGTPGGTYEVSTVPASALASNSTLSVIGNSLYFLGTSTSYGQELWRSDGTSAGTFMLQDLNPGPSSSIMVSSVYPLNGYQYFWADLKLWRTNGTALGTVPITTQIDNPIGPAVAVGNYLYYASTTQGVLWRTDGTAAGTVLLSQYLPKSSTYLEDELVNLNGTLLFDGGVDSATNVELAGILPGASQPAIIKDINRQAPNGSNPKNLIRVGNQAFFIANDGTTTSSQLWVTDGTGTGTHLVRTISSQTLSAAPLGNSLLYLDGYQLWKTDGTPGGTAIVQDLQASNPQINFAGALAATGNMVYFVLVDGHVSTGNELWESDGTSAGTHLVDDINPGTADSAPNHFTAVGNELYFDANDGTHGDELWKTDGTAQGTVMVDDVVAGSGSSFPIGLTNVAGTLYLLMYDSSGTLNLWKSDGTAAGTVEITGAPGMPIAPFGNLTAVEDELYFTADTAANGVELWKTNGTPSGTQLVDDLNPGSASSSPKFFEAMGNTLYFNAFDSSGQGELFKTDGTAAGTIQLTHSLTYLTGSISDKNGIRSLTAVGDTLFFAANDGVHGDELWSTDGTAAGTAMVQDIGPGDSLDDSANALPLLLSMGTFVLFAANDHQIGTELWRADAAPLPVPASISGTFFYDTNGNGIWDSGEAISPSWGVFLDTNGDGVYESGEPELICNSQGQYTFSNLLPGTYRVHPTSATNWTETAPPGGTHIVNAISGQTATNVNFGEVRGAAKTSAASTALFTGDSYSVNLSYGGFHSVTSWTVNWGDGSVQTISGSPTSASHTYTSASGTSPFTILAWANTVDGDAPAAPLTLAVYAAPLLNNGLLSLTGTSGNDSVSFTNSGGLLTLNLDGATTQYNSSAVTKVSYSSNGGNDTINLSGVIPATLNLASGNSTITNNDSASVYVAPAITGKTTINATAGTTIIPASTGTGIQQLDFAAINVSSGAKVVFANSSATLGNYSSHANRTLAIVDAGGLNIASGGTLDIGDNSMLLKYLAPNKTATDSMVNSLLTSGLAGQAWNGTGIDSSEASNDAFNGSASRAVGWADQNDVGVNSFEGDSADVADGNEIMIKFTYYGDSDLDGKVASSDSSNFSTGVHLTGNAYWEFGDFDYSGGKPTASDSQSFSTGLAAYKTFGQL